MAFSVQIRRGTRWIRYTYDDALRTSGTIMRRFTERGLSPGDRVAIYGENEPAWALTYLAAMRAGLTAVPLDPQLPPAEALTSARFVGVRLICAGATRFEGLDQARAEGDAEIVAMREPFIPPPGASRDVLPPAAAVEATSIASILPKSSQS